MDWDGYEMRETPHFVLSQESDIFHHTLDDYSTATAASGLQRVAVKPVAVSAAIGHLLTAPSLARVAGRPQIAIFVTEKPGG